MSSGQDEPWRPCLAVILAGGRSSRMGREKALLAWRGRPLVAEVLARLAPQAEALALNANGDPARFAGLGCPVLPDQTSGDIGPLAGIASALRHAVAHGYGTVLTVPSDAPFVPLDLAERLGAGLAERDVACVRTARGLEPLFALWRTSARPGVEEAIATGRLAVRDAMAAAGCAEVPFAEADAFANLNTPDDYQRAVAGEQVP